MRILVTGTNGLVGQQLLKILKQESGYELVAVSKGENRLGEKTGYVYEALDITDGVAVHALIDRYQPSVIIHAAALTQVDTCETNQPLCWNTNVTATRFLLDAAAKTKAHFIFLSTDFVFSGESGPYSETDIPGPVNYYGSSKLSAEKSVMGYAFDWTIIRTVLVYGLSEDPSRSNIFSWVYDSLKQGKPIKVVNDQFRTPTYAPDLAAGIGLVVRKKAKGIFHLSGAEEMTPYKMAMKIAAHFNLDTHLITEVDAGSFSQPAMRPPRTGFIISKAVNELGYGPRPMEECFKELSLSLAGKSS